MPVQSELVALHASFLVIIPVYFLDPDISTGNAVVTTSRDDGHPLDLRLADMLHRYGVPVIPIAARMGTI